MGCFVYILQSQSNHSFYKGATNDLVKRIKRHNAKLDPYTKKFAPWNLVWFTVKPTKAEAILLERKLKNLSANRLIQFIKKYPPPDHFGELPITDLLKTH